MTVDSLQPGLEKGHLYLLAIDTCGPSGSVALAVSVASESGAEAIRLLGQTPLEGRTYSATLVTAVRDLLTDHGIRLKELAGIVAVSGPGSFTGVRVGLSAAKGLAEPHGTAVIPVSRLEVLAFKAGIPSAALDAHRHEIFLRLADSAAATRELLAGQAELSDLPAPVEVAVCDPGAATLLRSAWPASRLVEVEPPSAADALRFALPRIRAGESCDLALLDGHYLRRSDAEIFGTQPSCPA